MSLWTPTYEYVYFHNLGSTHIIIANGAMIYNQMYEYI